MCCMVDPPGSWIIVPAEYGLLDKTTMRKQNHLYSTCASLTVTFRCSQNGKAMPLPIAFIAFCLAVLCVDNQGRLTKAGFSFITKTD